MSLILYHGSDVIVEAPKIISSKRAKDFNTGFYCTDIYQQAERWALRRKEGYVNRYRYEKNENLKMLQFQEMNDQWLEFIVACRLNKPHDYDIVEGPMADDQVYITVDDYVAGEI